ncbi:MAG: hypothetical protein ACRD0U_10325, partial [Acidimicrobiales bacterium]
LGSVPGRVVLAESPAPTDPVEVGRPFQLRYVAVNEGDEATSGHWDHLAILDAEGTVHYEDWHQQEAVAAEETYEAEFDIAVSLPEGRYVVWVTLDGGGQAPVKSSAALPVGVDGEEASGNHRLEVDEHPEPLAAPVSAGEPFQIHYRAGNAGDGASNGHYDRLVITGANDLWEGWHQVDPLEPGESYAATVDVSALAAGDYRLEWTLDWATNHPLAQPGPADPSRVRGETPFTVG